MTPAFLTVGQVIAIHADQISRYGGGPGIRDAGLLRSAVAQPSASFGGAFLHVDLFEMAAAYLFSLVKNHPFIDGNKRVGATAAIVFLGMNDVLVTAENDDLVSLVLGVAQGLTDKAAVAEFFRNHSNLR